MFVLCLGEFNFTSLSLRFDLKLAVELLVYKNKKVK